MDEPSMWDPATQGEPDAIQGTSAPIWDSSALKVRTFAARLPCWVQIHILLIYALQILLITKQVPEGIFIDGHWILGLNSSIREMISFLR